MTLLISRTDEIARPERTALTETGGGERLLPIASALIAARIAPQ